MLDDDERLMALGRLQIILQNGFNSILTEDAEASVVTDDIEIHKPFVIVESWHELGKIQQELNRWLRPEAYYKWIITYYNEYGHEAFQDMRFGKGQNGEPRNLHNSRPLYEVPEGLFELDDVLEWGFSDEYIPCSNCYKAIGTTPGYYGDKPRYAVVNDEILCGDCINENYEYEYIESVENNPENAINTRIISEERLTELGWNKLEEKYEAGIREGNNDDPKKVYKTIKNKDNDVLFTYETGQFDLDFWAWTKPKEEDT